MWIDLGQHFVFETLPVSLHFTCICAEIPHSASSVCLAKLEHIIVRPRGHTVRRSISADMCSTWSFSSRTLIFDLIFRKKRSLRSHVGPPIIVHSNFGEFCYQPKRSDVFRQRPKRREETSRKTLFCAHVCLWIFVHSNLDYCCQVANCVICKIRVEPYWL